MIFALAILIKIYKLMKLIDKKSSQTSTYKNMQTAAMMCLLEGFIGVLINLPSIYKNVFILANQYFDGSDLQFYLLKIYLIVVILNEVINYYGIVFDCIITLFVLKSYRIVILNVLMYPHKVYRIHWKKISPSSIVVSPTTAITRY
uniref:Uncharacterized protein n=1 Tax=Acrobeloides nanus TaxID=290746 RepID=A0A914EK19_9BILA